MTTIKSDKTTVNAPASRVFDKLSNLENLKPLLEQVPRDQIPADKQELFDRVQVTADTISIPGGPVGDIRMRVSDRLPDSLIQLSGEGTPVPMLMRLEIESLDADRCDVQVSVSLDIPVMLKPMVQGPLKKVVDQFAHVLGAIPF